MITIETYLEMQRTDESEISPNTLVSIYKDISLDEVNDLDVETFDRYSKELNIFLSNRRFPKGSVYKSNLDVITFGEYIDLEEYSKLKNWTRFLQIFYNDKVNFFSDEPVSILFYAQDEFMKYQTTIFGNYFPLFGDPDDDEPEEQPDSNDSPMISPNKRFADFKEKRKQEIQLKWGWILVAFNLAKNDITKLEKVLDLKMTYVLNILLLIKENNIDLNPQSFPSI